MSTTERKAVDEMTVAELRGELGEAGVEAPSGMKKETLQQLVASARGGAEESVGEVVAEFDEPVEEVAAQARNLPAVRASEAMIARAEITPAEVAAQHEKIKQVMDAVMKKGVHYGEIPGVNKPTLLKPGAEVLAVTLRLAPSYESEKIFAEDGHLTVISKARLTHIPSGLVIAEGEGMCSSREKKYAYRGEGRTCPACGAAGTIKKSKFPPRATDYPGADPSDPPGWYCHSKAGGCGANFAASDSAITDQSAEKVPNPDLPDTWNTVLKMSDKRALVAAILNGTAASDIFTQDVEDAGTAAADAHEYAAGGGETGESGKFGSDRKTGTWVAPQGWGEFGSRLSERIGEDEAKEWLGELAEKGFEFESVGAVVSSEEVSAERKADLWRRLLRVLEALEGEGECRLRPDAREVVRDAFAAAFDGLALDGPEWALSPTETEREQRGVVSASTDGAAAGEPEPDGNGSQPPASAGEPAEAATDDIDQIPF